MLYGELISFCDLGPLVEYFIWFIYTRMNIVYDIIHCLRLYLVYTTFQEVATLPSLE
jgi:hypothetical protein